MRRMRRMNTIRPICSIGFSVCLTLLLSTGVYADQVLPQSVVVFTTSDRPINKTDFPDTIPVTVYNLDAPREAEKALAKGLSINDIEAARATVKARIARYTPEQVLHIWGARHLAEIAGVTKTPAIVFDDIYDNTTILYGMTDLSNALTIWEDNHAQNTH